MGFRTAATELETARRRREQEVAVTRRLRGAVAAIDGAIEACEEANLLGITEPPEAVRERVTAAAESALDAVEAAGDTAAARVVATAMRRPARRVVVLMDILWEVQDVTLDVMVPFRRTLPGRGADEMVGALRAA